MTKEGNKLYKAVREKLDSYNYKLATISIGYYVGVLVITYKETSKGSNHLTFFYENERINMRFNIKLTKLEFEIYKLYIEWIEKLKEQKYVK